MSKKSEEALAVRQGNLAFKCNYCDGGQSDAQIGFDGVCSDEGIWYNIDISKGTWCRDEQCDCFMRYNGEITREELEKLYKDDPDYFGCYESQMLRDWRAMAGTKPSQIKRAKHGGLCVLTTRMPRASEADRMIFALFLIDDIFEGNDDEWDDWGYVASNSEYRMKFSLEQANQLLYWKYYKNRNRPLIPQWGSGLFRYISDAEAIQILQDAIKVKAHTNDEEKARAILCRFCAMQQIDPSAIGEPAGALTLHL